MNTLKNISPASVLRLGFGLMLLYSSTSIMRNPLDWEWVLPTWVQNILINFIDISTFLRLHAVLEFTLAILLLAWFLKPKVVKWVALITTGEFVGILTLSLLSFDPGVFMVTFRDIGLLAGSAALTLLLFKESEAS